MLRPRLLQQGKVRLLKPLHDHQAPYNHLGCTCVPLTSEKAASRVFPHLARFWFPLRLQASSSGGAVVEGLKPAAAAATVAMAAVAAAGGPLSGGSGGRFSGRCQQYACFFGPTIRSGTTLSVSSCCMDWATQEMGGRPWGRSSSW